MIEARFGQEPEGHREVSALFLLGPWPDARYVIIT